MEEKVMEFNPTTRMPNSSVLGSKKSIIWLILGVNQTLNIVKLAT